MKVLRMWAALITLFFITLPAFGQQTAEEYFKKGINLYEAKNYEEAIKAFEKAVELKPDYAEAHYNLAITFWQQKRYEKVSEHLRKILEIAPGSDTAKKAEEDIKVLKNARVYADVKETVEEVSPELKISERPAATLPELIEDLRFGPTTRRLAAARWLGSFPEEKAVEALTESIENVGETPEIKVAAVESMGKIALPSSIPILQKVLEMPDIPTEGKQAAIKALSLINTTESLKVIISSWAGTFPGGLSDQDIVEMLRKKGREDFAGIIRPAYLQTTGEKKMAMAMALGILKDVTGVPLMVNRLKEDYPGDTGPTSSSTQQVPPRQPGMPIAAPPMPEGPPLPPGGGYPGVIPILKKQTAESQGWSRKDEAERRAQIVEILGNCAGANQMSFLAYLSKNDQEKKVREAAQKAVKVLESRLDKSAAAYQKGTALAKEGKIKEAIPLIQTALKENPDASYVKEIKKLQARYNYDRALALLKEDKKEEAVTLLQSALELDPSAPFRKDAEDKLSELQVRPEIYGPEKMPLPPGIRGQTAPPPLPGQSLPPPPR